jgi:hypothetical protein
MKWATVVVAFAAFLLGSFLPDPAEAKGVRGHFHGHRGHHGHHFRHGHRFHHGHHFHHRHHHHGRIGVFIGAPIVLGGWWYHSRPPAYYAYPAAPAYIEQGDVPPEHWWYYCAGSKMYYPYVKECPGGWQRVAPDPPPPS